MDFKFAVGDRDGLTGLSAGILRGKSGALWESGAETERSHEALRCKIPEAGLGAR